MASKVFEHPFDLTKVRLQSQVLDATARFSGPIDCLVQTWRKEGIRGLYRVRGRFFCSGFNIDGRLAGLASSHSRSYGRECVHVLELLRAPKCHSVVRETTCPVSTVARSTRNGWRWCWVHNEFRSVSHIHRSPPLPF